MRMELSFQRILSAVILFILLPVRTACAEVAERGLTEADLMRGIGITVAATAIVLLVLVEFVFKPRMHRHTYRWLLLLGLFVAPSLAIPSATSTMFAETKTVQSCATCHVMHSFVNDLSDPESATLAARHFRNKWIPEHQCYACHTTYGMHGTLEAKRDGFRHWLLFVTDTYPEPIEYKGSYPNSNCLACHQGTPKYDAIDSHRLLAADLISDRTSCTKCHGPPHPVPSEREPGDRP
jgi:cytochrome c nitrite reductase small subunit